MKVLMVAFLTPPFSEVGAVRISKFIKYLSKAGHVIDVITADSRAYGTSISESYVKDFSHSNSVKRTFSFKKFKYGPREEGIYWAPFLLFPLIRALIFNRPDVVYFNGGPFFHWLLAPMSKLLGVKYILDLRDPWALNPYADKKRGALPRLLSWLAKKVESFAVKHAHAVINVTEPATKMYSDFYNNSGEEAKFITIPNGFDPDDFENLTSRSMTNFDIVYTGKFGNFRDPEPFLRDFKEYIQQHNKKPDQIGLVCIGRKEPHVQALVSKYELDSFTHFLGMKPYKECLEYVKGAGACLLISGNHAYEPTTKVFDYIALNKIIVGYIGTRGFLSTVMDTLGIDYNLIDEGSKISLESAINSKLESLGTVSFFNRETQAQMLIESVNDSNT